MAVERRWLAVAPVALTAPGTANGGLTIASTDGFKVKMTVVLTGISFPPRQLEVKRINSGTSLEVGPPGAIDLREDVSAYPPTTSYLFAQQQPRPDIPLNEISRAVYEEEPSVALRSILVDKLGNKIDKDHPLFVQLSDGSINIGTVNAELEVQLDHRDNQPHPGDVHDSVRIGDGTDELQINPDGSINVSIVPIGRTVDSYNEALAVGSGVETSVVSYTVPSGKTSKLERVEFSGENIARFTVYINGVKVARKRTHHGSGLSGEFVFEGIPLSVGDVVELKTRHDRPSSADFEGRIEAIEF